MATKKRMTNVGIKPDTILLDTTIGSAEKNEPVIRLFADLTTFQQKTENYLRFLLTARQLPADMNNPTFPEHLVTYAMEKAPEYYPEALWKKLTKSQKEEDLRNQIMAFYTAQISQAQNEAFILALMDNNRNILSVREATPYDDSEFEPSEDTGYFIPFAPPYRNLNDRTEYLLKICLDVLFEIDGGIFELERVLRNLAVTAYTRRQEMSSQLSDEQPNT